MAGESMGSPAGIPTCPEASNLGGGLQSDSVREKCHLHRLHASQGNRTAGAQAR